MKSADFEKRLGAPCIQHSIQDNLSIGSQFLKASTVMFCAEATVMHNSGVINWDSSDQSKLGYDIIVLGTSRFYVCHIMHSIYSTCLALLYYITP
jgi:hypothetical protein